MCLLNRVQILYDCYVHTDKIVNLMLKSKGATYSKEKLACFLPLPNIPSVQLLWGGGGGVLEILNRFCLIITFDELCKFITKFGYLDSFEGHTCLATQRYHFHLNVSWVSRIVIYACLVIWGDETWSSWYSCYSLIMRMGHILTVFIQVHFGSGRSKNLELKIEKMWLVEAYLTSVCAVCLNSSGVR